MHAINKGQIEVVRELIKNGVNIDAKDQRKRRMNKEKQH